MFGMCMINNNKDIYIKKEVAKTSTQKEQKKRKNMFSNTCLQINISCNQAKKKREDTPPRLVVFCFLYMHSMLICYYKLYQEKKQGFFLAYEIAHFMILLTDYNCKYICVFKV